MDFLKKMIPETDSENQPEKPTTGSTGDHGHREQPASSSELMAEAKYLAESAQQALRGETKSIDKSRLAESAEDVLEAGSKYGKLDDKAGFGQYVDKAQGYLHQYGGHSDEPSSHQAEGPKEEKKEAGEGGGDRYKEEEKKEEEKEDGGGYGDYAKMATGFMKKF